MASSPKISMSTINERGLEEAKILSMLEARLGSDLSFYGESILGSMCTLPHPLSRKVYHHYIDRNIGDPGLHPGLKKLEEETVTMLGKLLSAPAAVGSMTSGGTEANILAMWAAKRRSPGKRKVVLPESAHFSFDKAADLMDLQLIKIPVDEKGRVKSAPFLSALDDKVMAAVLIAGTTGLGAVDPIADIEKTLAKRKIPLHVDAAFGGFVLPFLEEAGYPAPAFDFSLAGVSSITIDPHKMGRSAIPAGAILFRSSRAAADAETEVSYLSGGKTRQRTIVGTRSGAAVSSVWATLMHLGREGYVETVRSCMENSMYLYRHLGPIPGIRPVIKPEMNVIGIEPEESSRYSAEALIEALRARGWALSLFPGFLRISVMPHVSRSMLDRFLHDLKELNQ